MSDFQPNDFLQRLADAQQHLDEGFAHLPPSPQSDLGPEAAAILNRAAEALHDNYPYAHPLYAGQMLKPPHPIAALPMRSPCPSIRTTTPATVAAPAP
jgi:tyrosine decarboxylase/aspartate 1-decarboxylase